MAQAKVIENLNTLFAPLGLKVDEVTKAAQSVKYKLYLPLDLDKQGKIRRAETNIKFALPSALGTNEFKFEREVDCLSIECRSNEFKVVNFNDLKAKCKTNALNLILGTNENGEMLYTNLSKAPHILVGGTTGSGKSELLHTFIASLIVGMPYTNAELLIIDPKRAEYSPYKNRERIRLITEMDEALKYLNYSVQIMENRYAELENAGAKDIYKYSGFMDMHPIVIIVDELADLIQTFPDVEKPIVRIAQKARACGIHLIIGTQSPRRNVVTGLIQTNMPTKIALHTSDQIESRIILGKAGAEQLLGKGDMLFHGNGAMSDLRIQSAYVDENTKHELASTLEYREYKESATPANNNSGLEKAIEWSHNWDNGGKEQFYKENHIEQPTPQKKRVGIIGGMINLLKVKPLMFESDNYPVKI